MVTIIKRFKVILLGLFLLSCTTTQPPQLPPLEEDSLSRLDGSPRHGEWVTYPAGGGDMVRSWLVYPERNDAAPVVIVIHEIYGLTDWARAVTDQFAAEGFIAIAPDFISGKGPGGGGSESVDRDGARALIGSLTEAEIISRLDATVTYLRSIPAAASAYGTVGYCWGGGVSFNYATADSQLDASVVFYGVSPDTVKLAGIESPVLGLYGGADNRVNATIPAAEAELKRLGKSYEYEIYPGAGHAFLRAQNGQEGANRQAAEQAWARALDFLREHLGR